MNFSFFSPFWHGMDKTEFINRFYKSNIYQETSLKNIVKFDPVIKIISADSKYFVIVLQYYTNNGKSVYEAVLGTVLNGKITELRSIYDLAETKLAHNLCG